MDIKKTTLDHLKVIIGSGAGRAIAFLSNIMIARIIGKADYGRFNIFFMVMIIAWLIPQAFDTTFIRYAKVADGSSRRNDIFKAIFQLKLIYIFLIAVFAIPLSLILAYYVFKHEDLFWLLVAAIISGSFLCLMNTVISIFQEKEKFGKYSVLQGLNSFLVFFTLLLSFFIFHITSVNSIVVIYLIISIIMGIICFYLVKGSLKELTVWDFSLCIQLVHFGKWIFAITIVFYLYSRIDIMFLANIVQYSELGIYSAAVQITMIISIITGAMGAVFLPKSINAVSSKANLKLYIKDAFAPVLLMNFIIIILMLFAPVLIDLFFGIEYKEAVLPLRILLLGYLIFSFYQPLSFLFYAVDMPKTRFFLEFLRLVMACALLKFMVPKWGTSGAAWALTVSMGVYVLGSILVLSSIFMNRNFNKDLIS